VFTLFVVPSIYMLVARKHVLPTVEEAEESGEIPELAGAAV